MDTAGPLSGHPQFSRWRARRTWGSGTTSFGNVIGDLVDGIDTFAADNPAAPIWRGRSWPIAVGCVMTLTHPDVQRALASLGACCMVVNKAIRKRDAIEQLNRDGTGIPQVYLPGFEELAPAGPYGPAVIGPSSPWPLSDLTLGPVRLAGWRPVNGRHQAPLLHAKALVLGTASAWEWDEDPMGMVYKIAPSKVWLGSANWTEPSPNHLEFGLWSTDRELVHTTFDFITDVIAFSEPLDTEDSEPSPELVRAVWDDDSVFAEALANIMDVDFDE